MRIAIVGNGPKTADQEKSLSEVDVVYRFNHAPGVSKEGLLHHTDVVFHTGTTEQFDFMRHSEPNHPVGRKPPDDEEDEGGASASFSRNSGVY